ncbi:MAG: DUF4442 domain-containing protein [Bdellovibrionales bacterium]
MRKSLKSFALKLINFWPPYLGAGIRVSKMSGDFRRVEVEMSLRFWNQNYVGTHFGGSLYAMCDPFFMLILMKNLGDDYIVWDKAATIRFKRPGRGKVKAVFAIDHETIQNIRREADSAEKVTPTFFATVKDESGSIVAEVEKLLYVRRKDRAAPKSQRLN